MKCQDERTPGRRESPGKGPEAGTEQRPGGLEHRARGTQWLGSVGGLGHRSPVAKQRAQVCPQCTEVLIVVPVVEFIRRALNSPGSRQGLWVPNRRSSGWSFCSSTS